MKYPSDLAAVLFDYDGVVADTMNDNFEAWKYAFHAFKRNCLAKDYFRLEGMVPREIAATLCRRYELSLDHISEIVEKKERYYKSHNSFRIYPEIESTIQHLKRLGIKTALITGASEKRVHEITPVSVLSLFDVIVCAEMVPLGKPHPGPYRKGLENLNVPAENALAVENAPLGIQSAHAAGIYCAAIPTTLSKKSLQEADMIIESPDDIITLIGRRKRI